MTSKQILFPPHRYEEITSLDGTEYLVVERPETTTAPVLPREIYKIKASSVGGGNSSAPVSNPSSLDLSASKKYVITLTANITNLTWSGTLSDGDEVTLIFKRGGTAYTVTLHTSYFESGLDVTIPSPLLDTTINTRDVFKFIYNATTGKLSCIGFARRY